MPKLTRDLTATLARIDRVSARAGAGPESGTLLVFRIAVTQAAVTLRLTPAPVGQRTSRPT